MSDKTTFLRLTDAELAILDGQCRPETQSEVRSALARIEAAGRIDLPHGLSSLVADVVTEARVSKLLIYSSSRTASCRYCGQSNGYDTYRSGPNRGRLKKAVPGIELAWRFIRMQDSISLGACNACIEMATPALRAALVGVEAQIPEPLHEPGQPHYVRHSAMECTACGWTGHEGEMKPARTLIGDGTYPSGCPNCPAKNGFGITPIESRDGYVAVRKDDETGGVA